jgi:glycosyltransferase involved in cell wall biosynthesis
MAKKTVSIVSAFYNEQGGVDLFLEALTTMFKTVKNTDFEIVCIDDGSTDKTLEELKALVKKDKRVRVLELSRNFGKEAAMTAGIDAATGDAVIPFDADLQDPADVIPQLIEQWQNGFEVVLARRANRDSDSFFKRKSANMFYAVHNKLSPTKIPANVGDFRLMSRDAVDALKKLPERQRFMKGLFAWVGYKTTFVDYTRAPRAVGESKFTGWKLWNFALEGITSFSIAPLRIWTYVGCFGALFSFIYGMWILYITLVQGTDVPGYPSLLISVLFLGSVQLISIGILGEYIGRIYLETKQRPTYIVREHHGKSNEA